MMVRARPRFFALLAGLLCSTSLLAAQPDPFAANNSVLPAEKDWKHGFRPSHFEYPTQPPPARWLQVRPKVALTPATAPAYVAAVKKFIEPALSGLVNDPLKWTPQQAGWYDMPWGGQGGPMSNGQIDPESGRDPLLGSYTGQILPKTAYPSNPPNVDMFQNHAVVYYNDVAAHQLGKIWRDPFRPDLKAAQFPEGSIVVKVEGATATEEQWPVLKGSSVSYIYRPSVEQTVKEPDPTKRVPVVTPMRFLQMAVRIKDKVASPKTGWVFMAFFYDVRSNGATPWDRASPAGATWGNDPELAKYPDGRGPGKLMETWVADNLPGFVSDGLGWGGRLAGPLDLGVRFNVVTVTGKRPATLGASSCVSCHGSAQYPYMANLYPSPNMPFPPETGQFLLFEPGSKEWARWFQSRPGNVAMSGAGRSGIVATDYDMMLTFAVMAANGSVETNRLVRHRAAGH
ncbi:MAG TPA: hypothetical protein VFQ20_11320 [Burkholderiaceae bacterium]|nr:hypothetical protein [Burkholderiaceae bacterium]